MDKREILQQIIDNNGSCDWLGYGDNSAPACSVCPLSKLKKRPDGTYMSCWDALVPVSTSNGWVIFTPMMFDPDKVYLNKATEILQDIMVEDMLTGEIEKRE